MSVHINNNRKDSENKQNIILESIVKLINNHPIISAILRSLPGIIAITVSLWGSLIIKKHWITVGVVVIYIIITVSIEIIEVNRSNLNMEHNKDLERKNKQLKQSYEVISSKYKLLRHVNAQRQLLDRNLIENRIRLFENDNRLCERINTIIPDVHKTNQRLGAIAESIKQCLSKLSTVEASNIYVSIAISLKGIKGYEWIVSPEGSIVSLKKLKSSKSLFRYVAENDSIHFAYIPDKQKPLLPYKYDKLDSSHENKGSIVCWEITLSDERHASLIVSISTYGEHLVDLYKKMPDGREERYDDYIIKEAYETEIQDIILREFEDRLTEELFWYVLAKRGTI